MVEVIAGIVRHPDTLHDAPRAQIRGNSEGHNLAQPQDLEAIVENLACPLRGQTLPPAVESDPPANLDAGRKMRLERGNGKSDKANKSARRPQFGGEQPKPVPLEMSLDPIRPCIAFLRRQHAWKVLHHADIGVQARERLAVPGSPFPEDEARCIDTGRPRRHI